MNRKSLFLCLVALLHLVVTGNNQLNLLTTDKKPSQLLLDLLALCNISHDGTLEAIVPATQKAWLRTPGSERWQMQEIDGHAQEDKLILLLTQIGCLDEQAPTEKNFDYAIILGATVHSMRARLAYLIKTFNSGVRFNTILFLVGARPLDPTVESSEVLLTTSKKDWQLVGPLPTTEAEMARLIVDQTALPEEFASINIEFVDTPMQTIDGVFRRPNTGDTIEKWLRGNPTPGKCLAISGQPYVGYQNAVMQTYIPDTFYMETAGNRAAKIPNELKVSVILDSLARWLYQEYQLIGKKK